MQKVEPNNDFSAQGRPILYNWILRQYLSNHVKSSRRQQIGGFQLS